MSRPTKISLLVLGIPVVSAIVLMVLIKTLVTPEKIRETLVSLAEKSLQRKVVLGKIEIGLLVGVSLHDLRVRQKEGADDWFSLKSMELHYRLLPLLTGKVVVDQVKLVQPNIVVIRKPDGSFNFSDLLGGNAGSAEKAQPAVPAAGKPVSSGRALDLLVNEVALSGGELLFIDGVKGWQAPVQYAVNQLSFQARQIILGKSFPIELSAALNGGGVALTVQLNGDITLAGTTGGGQLLQNASLQLKDVRADVAGMKVGISGGIDYDDRQLKTEKLHLNLGDQQA